MALKAPLSTVYRDRIVFLHAQRRESDDSLATASPAEALLGDDPAAAAMDIEAASSEAPATADPSRYPSTRTR